MFSAIYLVCFAGQPCEFFVDSFAYDSKEECVISVEDNIVRNTQEILAAGGSVPTVDYQCISWSKA